VTLRRIADLQSGYSAAPETSDKTRLNGLVLEASLIQEGCLMDLRSSRSLPTSNFLLPHFPLSLHRPTWGESTQFQWIPHFAVSLNTGNVVTYYCNEIWPQYQLGTRKWCENGSLDYNTILQLHQFCEKQERWSEIPLCASLYGLISKPPSIRGSLDPQQELKEKDTDILNDPLLKGTLCIP
jgi:hypothetical protein